MISVSQVLNTKVKTDGTVLRVMYFLDYKSDAIKVSVPTPTLYHLFDKEDDCGGG